MKAVTDIYVQSLDLPLAQRAELAQRIIDSLNDQDAPLGASDEEISQRLNDIASGEYESLDSRNAIVKMRTSLADALTRIP